MKRLVRLLLAVLVATNLSVVVAQPAVATACSAANAYAGGDGQVGTPYQIANAAQFQYFANQIQAATSNADGKFFELTADIDFLGCSYSPPDSSHPFKGSLDGNSHSVSNFSVSRAGHVGLFGVISSGTVKDLSISGASMSSTGPFSGVLAGYVEGTFGSISSFLENISISNSTVTSDSNFVGGVAGWATWGVSVVNVSVAQSTVSSTATNTGGAFGKFQGISGSTLTKVQVISTNVTGLENVGGVVGEIADAMASASKLGFFAGTISRPDTVATGTGFGGVIGVMGAAKNFSQLAFRGTINLRNRPTQKVGFLIGDSGNFNTQITDSYARGDAQVADGTVMGGMVGSGAGTISLTRGYVQVSAVVSGTRTEAAISPFSVPAATLSNVFYDSEEHTNWTSPPAGTAKTATELLDEAAFATAGFSLTSNEADVTAGTDTAVWYEDLSIDGGHLFLTWEYLGKTLVPCVAGRTSYNGIGDCDPVPMGTFTAFTGQLTYELCPAGYFQSNVGATACDPAPEGTYAPEPGQSQPTDCIPGTYQPNRAQMYCLHTDPGYFAAAAGSRSQTLCPPGTWSEAQATSCYALPQYTGPIVVVSNLQAVPGQTMKLNGRRMSGVTAVVISGASASTECSDTSCSFVVPAGLVAGRYDLELLGDHGRLTVQDAVTVIGTSGASAFQTWTRKISDSEVKVYLKNPVGIGKVQFMVSGKEIAWVRAVDASDPKLKSADGEPYLVRTVKLKQGKNVIEIYVDGIRQHRAAYSN